MAVKKKTNETLNPLDQIKSYLKEHKDEHFNFEKTHEYVVSSGSLLLDIEMGGGIRPSVIRASGVVEGGKTSCALSLVEISKKRWITVWLSTLSPKDAYLPK